MHTSGSEKLRPSTTSAPGAGHRTPPPYPKKGKHDAGSCREKERAHKWMRSYPQTRRPASEYGLTWLCGLSTHLTIGLRVLGTLLRRTLLHVVRSSEHHSISGPIHEKGLENAVGFSCILVQTEVADAVAPVHHRGDLLVAGKSAAMFQPVAARACRLLDTVVFDE